MTNLEQGMKKRIEPSVESCTACTACMNVCPQDAILMRRDPKGFWVAEVDESKCVECGLCLEVCHVCNNKSNSNVEHPLFYAAYSKDKENVEKSSSGGVFYELCKVILQRNGVIYGAVQDTVTNVVHKRGEMLEQVEAFRRSKYLESFLGDCYVNVEKDLKAGKAVLFSGVGCQIAGLYSFLRRDYENLYTCEVVCHGIPSQTAYEKYLQMEKDIHGQNKVCGISFRDKSNGWSHNSICIELENGKSEVYYSGEHPLHWLYLVGINMRPLCGRCASASLPRKADITLADFWKYRGCLYAESEDRGLSLIAVNNEKGKVLLANIEAGVWLDEVTEEVALNSCRHMSNSPVNSKGQEAFLQLIQKHNFKVISELFICFGGVVMNHRLHTMKSKDILFVFEKLWNDSMEVIYLLSENDTVIGTVTYKDIIENYKQGEEWINYDFKYVTMSDDCIAEIQSIFDNNGDINKIPILDDMGRLYCEVRRKGFKREQIFSLQKELEELRQVYETAFYDGKVVLVDDYTVLENKDLSKCKVLVDRVSRARLLKLIHGFNAVSFERYENQLKEQIEFAVPFMRLLQQGNRVLFVKRPDCLPDFNYSEAAQYRIREEQSFVALSENVKENEEILKSILREKYSVEYVEELRKVPPIVMRGNKYVHVDFGSKYINTLNGCRKTEGQPSKYDYAVHMYGRCGIFGYAVEDADTLPSALQNLFNKCGEAVKVINHGLWGADDKKILSNINEDVCEHIIAQQDIVVVYMNYFPGIKFLEKMGIEIFDTTEYFHKFMEGVELFYDKPGHMTSEGYKIIADSIKEQLEQIQNNKYCLSTKGTQIESAIVTCIAYDNARRNNQNSMLEVEIDNYVSKVKEKLGTDFKTNDSVGAIVMNCNPFTTGHRYLIEKARAEVDSLIVFVLEEDKSYFSFQERYEMVKAGVANMENVHVFPSGKFVLSALTFPEYFIKENIQNVQINPAADIELFVEKIAPCFNIKKRFVGTEPQDNITGQYNEALKAILPQYGVELREIERLKCGDCVVSASVVRKLLEERKYEEVKKYVPVSTFEYLTKKFDI